jgi:uncharacterized repeat protein (TIGR01451 family)
VDGYNGSTLAKEAWPVTTVAGRFFGRNEIRRSAASIAAVGAVLALLVWVPPASADLDGLLSTCSSTALEPHPGYRYRFCNDGLPPSGGILPNEAGTNAVEVPAKYQAAVGDDWTGLPPRASDATAMPGADSEGNIALDVDLALPDSTTTPMPAGGYPLIVFMHGCCGGNKGSWEDTSFDAGGEKWHYNNAWFASRGYVVITYTARGFVNAQEQGSTGETQLDSRRFEINDFQYLAGILADEGDLDKNPSAGRVVEINPQKVVTTGGSYGGGFSWMALTDPLWTSPRGTSLKLAATAPKYGWTDLLHSLVPTGRHFQSPGQLPAFDGTDSTSPVGLPKKSINAGLFGTGTAGTNHTTFPPEIDAASACLNSTDPFETNPLCTSTLSTVVPSFICDRSAYYQADPNDECGGSFFSKIAVDPSWRIPIFNAATFTDPLFPPVENRRMANRILSLVSNYPIQQYYGDYQHFVQNKAKEWGDMCGSNHHVCTFSDYPGGDVRLDPNGLVPDGTGVTTRLNRFIDYYAAPPIDLSRGEPAANVTASLQRCQNLPPATGADEPGRRFTAGSFAALTSGTLLLDMSGAQTTVNNAEPNPHAVTSDPVANDQGPNDRQCVIETTPAGPGVATYESAPLASQETMIGATRVSIDYSVVPEAATEGSFQLNSRLYDVFPDGSAVMVDRGARRVDVPSGTVSYELHGNGWRFDPGHRIRIEIAQDDDPYLKASNVSSSATLTGVHLAIPVREEADLAVTKTDSPDPVSVGAFLTYTLGVANAGPQDATGLVLTDTLHKSLRFRSATPTQGRCVLRGGRIVKCDLAELAAGESATVTILVRPTRAGTVTNSATVDASQPTDPIPANNTVVTTTTVVR